MKHFDIIKKGIFLLLIGCICIIPFGCSDDETEVFGSLAGVIHDEKGNALHAVEITLTPGGKTTVTGTNGYYEFSKLKPQIYKVFTYKKGYQPDAKQITVITNQTAPGDFKLKDLQN